MSTTNNTLRNQVSGALVAVAMIVCSGLWLAAACEYYATSRFKLDWSATPLFWMLAVLITPTICFAGCMILADRRKWQRLTLVEWWALAAAFLPVTLGSLLSVWVFKVLHVMIGA